MSSINSKFINISLFLIIIFQNPLWMFWGGIGIWTSYFLVFILIIYLMIYDNGALNIVINRHLILFIALFLLFIIRPIFYEARSSSYFILMTIFLCLALKNRYNTRKVMEYLTSYLSIIIIISLPLWLVHTYITPLPLFNTIDISMMKTGGTSSVIIKNYLFFVTTNTLGYDRFYSMFNEPGELGTLCAFVLFGNRYNIKDKRNLVILTGAFFTYSLAFYALTLVGYLLTMLNSNTRKMMIPTTFIAITAGSLYYFVKDLEIFQKTLLYRFENFGINLIDERNAEILQRYFGNFIFSSDSILGMGTSFLKERFFGVAGNSYKLFFIEYGILGFIILVSCYLKLFMSRNKFDYFLFLLFLVSFSQRAALFTTWQIVLFYCISNANYFRQLVINEKQNRI